VLIRVLIPIMLVTLLAACGSESDNPQVSTTTMVEVTPLAEEASSEQETSESEESSPDTVLRASDCLPGNWEVDMDSLMQVFQIEGNPKHLSGTYELTFREDFSFAGIGDNIVFRISNPDGYVDVHNSWTEDGMWGAATSEMTFEEVLVVIGSSLGEYADEAALIGGPELNDSMVVLEGMGYKAGEAFGMVNGQFRTPPLDDSGEALSAIGIVDCTSGTMQLGVNGAGWKGGLALSKTA
jgi:hypothetical protein